MNNLSPSWIDKVGATAGTLCAVQCLLLPLLPFFLAQIMGPWEKILLGVGVVMATWACMRCCRRAQVGPAVLLLCGLTIAIMVMMGILPEGVLAMVALIWVGGHVWSYVKTTKSMHCCSSATPHEVTLQEEKSTM